MNSKIERDENNDPNIESKDEKKHKSTLNWSLILKYNNNSSIQKKDLCFISNLNLKNRYNKEHIIKKKNEWIKNFEINRIFFEEFPIYRREFQYPKMDNNLLFDKLSNNWIKNSIKFVPRYFCHNNRYEGMNNSLISFFINKKVCLIDNEEYLFHSRNQLLSKLRWYGARTLNYYTSRADYVICCSSYVEVMNKINKFLSGNRESEEILFINNDRESENYVNLRGIKIGKQIKLTEIELLEFLGEDLEIAINMLHISELNDNRKRLELLRPRTIWELIGNKDCAEELYRSLWNLRFQSEDLNSLNKFGFIEEIVELNNDSNDELCGIFINISPNNIGSQICTELTALGCGYDIKVYKGSDVVEPIIKQWKKNNFFKLFDDSDLPPVCTIMTDCSNVIKPSDIMKIRNSYYNSLFFKGELMNNTRKKINSNDIKLRRIENKGTGFDQSLDKLKKQNKKLNPGAIVFILEDTSETAQFILNNCKNNNRSFNCNRSYFLNKFEGNNIVNNPIKVFKFSNLSKASLVCKLFNKFNNLILLNMLINQFGPNLLKISNILYWIYLLENKNAGSQLNYSSLTYTPIFFNSAFEIPLLIIRKCLLNYNHTVLMDEIWNFTSFGFLEDQNELFELLLKLVYDLISSIIVSIDENINFDNRNYRKNYLVGFDSCDFSHQDVYDSLSIYSIFLSNISEVDTFYPLDKFPHMTYHTVNHLNNYMTSQEEKTCESYFSTLYSVTLFSLTAILKFHIPNNFLYTNKIMDMINCKLIKYNPSNTNYIKELSNYYSNRKQGILLNWKYIEYLYRKDHNFLPISPLTWRSISVDSNIPHLYFRNNADCIRYHDIVTYTPSRIPKLNIRIPDIFKQNYVDC